MDIPTLANDIWNLLQPLLPVLATKGAEELGKRAAGEVWDAIRNRPETQKLTEEMVSEPENPDVQGAFKYHLRETLKSDPVFAAQLQALLENVQKETYGAKTRDGGIAQGKKPLAGGAHSVVAETVRGNIHYGPVTYLTQSAPIVEKPAPRSSLPKQPYFFGRKTELDKIKAALSPDARTWGILINGPGGIGKTALAIKAADDAPSERFLLKIFITAKVRELTPDGEKPLPDFSRSNYLRMLEDAAYEIGQEGGLSHLADEERPNALRRALEGKQALLIFDNLETLSEDEHVRLFQFLARLPDGNKAIVTSRYRSEVDAWALRLYKLSKDAALQLMGALSERYPRLTQAVEQEREKLYLLTQGNPLLITWVAGQLGRSRSHCRTIAEACDFLEQAPPSNDPLEYVFGDLLKTFSEPETRILAALTHFEVPAKLGWLVELVRLPPRAAETALEDLAERSVINSAPDLRTYLLPPLTANFLRARHPQVVQETSDNLANYAYELIMQYGGDNNYEGFNKLEAEWPLLAAALPRFLQPGTFVLQIVCRKLDRFLEFSGRWNEWLSLSQKAEANALDMDDLDNAGWRAFWAGWVHCLLGQSDDIFACATRAAKHWQNSSPRNKAIAIRLWGIGCELQKAYPDAIAAYFEVLQIHLAINPESDDVAIALNDLARIEHQNEEYFEASRHCNQALSIARKLDNHEGIVTYTSFLAQIALDQENWVDGEYLTREALTLAAKIGRQESVAINCYRLAKALLRQDRSLDEAASLARSALGIFTSLQMSADVEETRKILDEIEARLKGT